MSEAAAIYDDGLDERRQECKSARTEREISHFLGPLILKIAVRYQHLVNYTHPPCSAMDDQPYSPPEGASQPAASTTFDPLAVSPAFARRSSSNMPAQPAPEPFTRPSPHLHIPELGDPSLMGELPATDPLSILLQKHLPPHIRPLRDLSGTWHASSSSAANAPTNELPDPFSTNDGPIQSSDITPETVRTASASNAWRKIAVLARTQLEDYSRHSRQPLIDTSSPSTSVNEALHWWSIRLYALARLKLYSMLRTELGALWQVLSTTLVEDVVLADTEQVPFTLRVLRATEPKFRGDTRTTVEQYTLLVQLCKQQMRRAKAQADEEGESLWRGRGERVGCMLAFTLAEAKDYTGAIEVLLPLVERALPSGDGLDEEEVARRVQLVVVTSRIWIQAGDLSTAQTLLDRAQTLTTNPALLQHITHARTLISAIAHDLPTAPTNPSSPASSLNQAITSFYSAHLDESIAQLQGVLSEHPALVATADAVVFNLATLYELGPGGEAEVVERKSELLADVAKWSGEPGVAGSSFKL